jgi:GNAT superfamily N-acetyltransferase
VLLALFGTAAANAADDDCATAAASSSSASVAFRRASAADLPAIVRLLADDALGSTRETAPTGADARVDPVYAAAFDAIDGDPNNELVVGVCDCSGAVVACMQLTFIPNLTLRASTRAQIEGVRVRADMRGRNIGRAMFRYAEQRARQRGCALLQLTTNTQRPEAAKFYTQLGYVASHIGFKKAIV